MISVYKIKPAFQKLLQPVLLQLHKAKITANQITVAAVVLSGVLGYLFLHYQEHNFFLLLVPLGLLLRMALNALDGMMATQYKMQSKTGEVLNELGDVISDAVIIFPFVIIPPANPFIIVLFGVLSIINEFSGVLGKALGGERRYEGPMGKSDRALVIGVFCLVSYFWRDLLLYTDWVFLGASILVLFSTFIRLKKSVE